MLRTVSSFLLFLLSITAFSQQRRIIPGKYTGSFSADGHHTVNIKLYLKKNKHFTEERKVTSLYTTRSTGKWEIQGDMLLLYPRRIEQSNSFRCVCKDNAPGAPYLCDTDTFYVEKGVIYFFKPLGEYKTGLVRKAKYR
jgi:hypothetical protein